jgi:hypothetical protein
MKIPWSLVTPVLGFVEPEMAATNCSVSIAGVVFVFVLVVGLRAFFHRIFGGAAMLARAHRR